MADTRTLLTRDVLAAIEQQFEGKIRILQPVIKRSVRFAESAVAGQSILAYEPHGPGAEAYRAIARRIMGHE
jgi:chromosome partitioning protein